MSAISEWLFLLAIRASSEVFILSCQALILILCVWLGLKLFRVKQPVLRHHFWLLTLIATVMLPVANTLTRRFPGLQPRPAVIGYLIEAPHATLRQPEDVNQPQAFASKVDQPAKISVRSRLFQAAPIGVLLFIVWLIGILAALVRLAWERITLGYIRRRAKVATLTDLNISVEEVTFRSDRLRLSTEIDSPQISGVLRPLILLPADLNDWTTPGERRAMIQHELVHLARFDHLVNLFQTVVRIVFFFHPAIRYACHQISLEREVACDNQVIALGTRREVYAESLLKAAERSLQPKARYQIAFFPAKQTLERRVEMILNYDGARTLARHWIWTMFGALTIASVAWLLLPSTTPSGAAQTLTISSKNLKLLQELGDRKAFAELIEIATQNPAAELRLAAAVRLTQLEGDGSSRAIVELYDQTNEAEVKTILIDALARISEIEPLTRIALSDQTIEFRERALRRIKYLKNVSESADIRNWEGLRRSTMVDCNCRQQRLEKGFERTWWRSIAGTSVWCDCS